MADHETLVTQENIDRLVDGELSEPQRRDLIERLESSTGGWRRCTLAFLEADEFRRALCHDRFMAAGGEADTDANSHSVPATDRVAETDRDRLLVSTRARRRWTTLAASAVVLAFVAGLGAGRASSPHSQRLAQTQDAAPAPDRLGDTISGSPLDDDAAVVDNEPATSDRATGIPPDVVQQVGDDFEEVRIVGLVRVLDGGSSESRYTMPVYTGSGLDQNWLASLPLPYSEEDVERLQQDGYRLRQRRQLMQVDLADGRSLAIPFGTLQLQYVGHEVN